MGRDRFLRALAGTALLCAGPFTWSCAQEPSASRADDESVTVTDQVVTDDLMTGGRRVRVVSGVQGDAAVAGADVTITGPVDGYVMSAGRNVTLEGSIGNDLWAAGATVNVDSEVGNNVMAAGRDVHLHSGTVVGNDAQLAGNLVVAEGRVERDLRIGARTADIGANVGGTVEVRAEHVTVRPDAVIAGDLVVRAPQPPDISPEATIGGNVRFEEAEQRGAWMARPWLWVLSLLALLVLGFAAITFSPPWAGRVAGTLARRPGASLTAGLLVVVLTPVVAAALAITVVGVPLAMVLLAFYVVVLLLSGVFVSYRIGSWLFDRMHRSHAPRWARLVLGVLVVSAAMFLPVVGWIVALAVVVTGVGALALERRDLFKQLRSAGAA